MNGQTITRRDIILIASGLAVVCCAKLADSSINGFEEGDAEALDVAVANLDRIPSQIGNWTSTDGELSEREQEAAGIVGYVRRRYTNERTGYQVHLTVLCGHSGPISVHPPTACFEGIGYKVVSGPNQTSVSADDDLSYEFNASSFRQSDASVPEIVRVFWGWGTDGQWSAPENPRFAYRGQSFLYKIYVTDRWLDETGETSLPQIESFMKEALPTITAAISQDDSQS